MPNVDVIQGTNEWREIRCGKITASRFSDVLATVKSGEAAARRNYRAEIVVERMTGVPTDQGFVSREMMWGTEQEPEARTVYELRTGAMVEQVGFVTHPDLDYLGASPDGLVGDDGSVEIKCPNTSTHIHTLRTRSVPKQYRDQMQGVMLCAERSWCDYVSYDPRMRDPRLMLCVIRVERDDEWIKAALDELARFTGDVDFEIAELEKIAEAM